LVPKLARDPRGWLLEHRDGLRTTLLVLDGVVADYNFAVKTGANSVISAQLYLPPPPGEHHYSRLAAVVDAFFRSRRAPWPVERSLLISGMLDRFRTGIQQSSRIAETPELELRYGPKS
jgi:hypothetical protein